MENEKETTREKKEKKTILLFLILVALIIIIFLLIRCMGVIDHRTLIPTGNVDVFDIIFGNDKCDTNCNCNCNCPTCPTCPTNPSEEPGSIPSNPSTGGTITENPSTGGPSTGEENKPTPSPTPSPSPPPTPPEEQEDFLVYDKDKMYSKDTPLNIFTQTSYYVADGKIAPASENSYQFVIRNNNDFNVQYSLTLKETNEHNIKMRYRLKVDGEYIAGSENEYVTFDQLNQTNIELASRNHKVYTLDWKWVESDNDTEVGSNIEANYQLALEITASAE